MTKEELLVCAEKIIVAYRADDRIDMQVQCETLGNYVALKSPELFRITQISTMSEAFYYAVQEGYCRKDDIIKLAYYWILKAIQQNESHESFVFPTILAYTFIDEHKELIKKDILEKILIEDDYEKLKELSENQIVGQLCVFYWNFIANDLSSLNDLKIINRINTTTDTYTQALSQGSNLETVKVITDFIIQRIANIIDFIQADYSFKEEFPNEIREEYLTIQKELVKYDESSNNFSSAKNLILECKSHLISIKEKLGRGNEYYLQISTILGELLLHKTINRYNAFVNEDLNSKLEDQTNTTLFELMLMSRQVWNIILNIEVFDTNGEFKEQRLNRNKNNIEKFISYYDENFGSILNYHSDFGYLAKTFIKQHYPDVLTVSHLPFSGIYRETYSAPSNQFSVTYNFMAGYISDGILDLSTEDECFERLFNKTKEFDSYHSCHRQFIEFEKRYPNGKNIQKAKDILYPLEKDYAFYSECIRQGTIETYQRYVSEYPTGLYIKEIQNSIEKTEFKKAESIGALKAFVKKYPLSDYSKIAREKIRKKKENIGIFLEVLVGSMIFVGTLMYIGLQNGFGKGLVGAIFGSGLYAFLGMVAVGFFCWIFGLFVRKKNI